MYHTHLGPCFLGLYFGALSTHGMSCRKSPEVSSAAFCRCVFEMVFHCVLK